MILTIAYGGGTNSTAMIIGLLRIGVTPDIITFADTGGERPDTYAYVEMFSAWLEKHGSGPIHRVQSQDRQGNYYTLEQKCLDNKMLPSLAYGYKSCSEKHKQRPQHKFIRNHPLSRASMDRGEKIIKAIGYDAGEKKRSSKEDDRWYTYRYPLREWGWDRKKCAEVILEEGLPLPGKSSCYFCPAMKKKEILILAKTQPKLLKRALVLEANALENLDTVQGLGRNFAWKDLIEQGESFPDQYETYSDFSPYCGCYDG